MSAYGVGMIIIILYIVCIIISFILGWRQEMEISGDIQGAFYYALWNVFLTPVSTVGLLLKYFADKKDEKWWNDVKEK